MIKAYLVIFECETSSNCGWGKIGNRVKFIFNKYDLQTFQDTAPGGWIIREIRPGYEENFRFVEGQMPLIED